MFGLSLSCQLIQGPAVRTWNCVAHFANLLWYKFNHVRPPIMPRSRRRHHSRSRTRSRSHSCDKDREPKRRKIESFDSPQHKRSLSPEEYEDGARILKDQEIDANSNSNSPQQPTNTDYHSNHKEPSPNNKESPKSSVISKHGANTSIANKTDVGIIDISDSDDTENPVSDQPHEQNTSQSVSVNEDDSQEDLKVETSNDDSDLTASQDSEIDTSVDCKTGSTSDKNILKTIKSEVSPKKALSPKQIQKKLQVEKQREEQRKEREKKKQEVLEEKLKLIEEKKKLKQEKEEQKLKEKQEKQEQKQKEVEEKQKEKELKEEKKRKEREEKEQKRKEKEERDEQKRKEQEERHKEKQKQEEKKQKAAAAFVNFFTKKLDTSIEEKRPEESVVTTSSTFMPFEVKSDMKLAPTVRNILSDEQKDRLVVALCNQNGKKYLDELRAGKNIGKSGKTWPAGDQDVQDDVIIVEDINPGETIEEQTKTNNKIKAKFLKFNGNRRPPYFGTWRKKSKFIKPRKPFVLDKEHFDYEIDSDEDWEEGEDSGESLRGSDDEDKENESENEYEVDNEFFVPHGHLSDDEVNDEEDAVISPEAHKAKLKLLKKEFEEERQGKTQRIKPRVIGCIWYNKNQDDVDQAIYEFLKPLSIISNGPIIIKKRSEFILQTSLRKSLPHKPLDIELVPDFLKFIHRSTNNQKSLIVEFLNYMNKKNINIEISKSSLRKQLKQFASWSRQSESDPLRKKYCWLVHKEVGDQYNIDLDLALPN